jgi:cytochrome o ubiquinol oxidase operon protein cyoD
MSKYAQEVVVASHEHSEGSFGSYSLGFGLSLVLTGLAYFIVTRHLNQHAYSHLFVMVAIFVLAIAQVLVQLICFLHLNRGSKSRWNLTILAFALIVIGILVGGSIWIMYNLNTRMTPTQVQQYLNSQNGL